MSRRPPLSRIGLLLLLAILPGCAGGIPSSSSNIMLFIPGASGNGPWYDGLHSAWREAHPEARIHTFRWGMPLPLYMFNLQDKGVHESAEKKLAAQIQRWRSAQPDGRLVIIAHSAGCGVALGALARLDTAHAADHVILLAPSVSPGYDLEPALRHVTGQVNVFHSTRDILWLQWRTSNFGTYDNIKTPAAGHVGFDLSALDPILRARVTQHPFDESWSSLGNDGDHFGAVAREFAVRILAPLITEHQSIFFQ